jgi:hypothetical protein
MKRNRRAYFELTTAMVIVGSSVVEGLIDLIFASINWSFWI